MAKYQVILLELGIIFFFNPKKNIFQKKESLIINKNPNESNWEPVSVSGTPPAPHTYISILFLVVSLPL